MNSNIYSSNISVKKKPQNRTQNFSNLLLVSGKLNSKEKKKRKISDPCVRSTGKKSSVGSNRKRNKNRQRDQSQGHSLLKWHF